MFHIYLIMKVGNFIYYNIKELVAIRFISIRNWNYLHTLDDNFLCGFCKNRTLNHKFPTECGRWQNMCTEHGLTRSGLEASTLTITLPMRVFGEHFWSVSQRIHIFHFVVDCPLYENIKVKFLIKLLTYVQILYTWTHHQNLSGYLLMNMNKFWKN